MLNRAGGTRGLATVVANSGRSELLEYMLDIGAEVDDKNGCTSTTLFCAAQGGHVEICRILLACGTEVDKKDNSGYMALTSLAMYGHLKVCELLLTHNVEVNNKTIQRTPPTPIGGHGQVCGGVQTIIG